jgi:hypothetical protein
MYSVDNVFRATYDGEARTIDLAGHYVVPPFADAHNHAFADDANVDEQRARFLRAGIFYVKNPNSSIRGTAAIRSLMNRPETVDVIYANGGLTTKGGHPTQIYDRFGPGMSDNAYFIVDSAADLDRVWPLIRAGKPDFIKLYLEHSEDPKQRRGSTRRSFRRSWSAFIATVCAQPYTSRISRSSRSIRRMPSSRRNRT